MDCLYPAYMETYLALRGALERDDRRQIRSLCLSAAQLEGPAALAAASAQLDALSRVPMRAKVHVCRLRLGPGCSAECCESRARAALVTRA